LQQVRDENAKLHHELHQEFSATLGQPFVTTNTPVTSSATGSSSNFQTQMLTILNDTFSKLSSVISDTSSVLQDTKQALSGTKSSDSKVEWIKFSGDHKKFWSWYLAIITQLLIAPWTDLFIAATNSVVQSTMNTSLNSKLYAKVIGALEGPALQHMIFHSHLQANGVLLLQELHQMYKPKNVPEVIAAKTIEFWGNTKRQSHESVDDYYNRFQ
jgi:hypothetical protein